jgi:hypothetical protein
LKSYQTKKFFLNSIQLTHIISQNNKKEIKKIKINMKTQIIWLIFLLGVGWDIGWSQDHEHKNVEEKRDSMSRIFRDMKSLGIGNSNKGLGSKGINPSIYNLAHWYCNAGVRSTTSFGTDGKSDVSLGLGTAYTQHYTATEYNPPLPGGSIPLPSGVTEMVRLNDGWSANSTATSMSYEMIVAEDSVFSIHWYMVAQTPWHKVWEQPYLKITILDENGNPIECYQRLFVVGRGLKSQFGFDEIVNLADTSRNVLYSGWRSMDVNLSKYTGRKVSIKIEVGDCSLSGHYAYAFIGISKPDYYIAPASGISSLQTIISPKDTTITVAGLGYWMPSGTNSNNYAISQTGPIQEDISVIVKNGDCESIERFRILRPLIQVQDKCTPGSWTLEAKTPSDIDVQWYRDGTLVGKGAVLRATQNGLYTATANGIQIPGSINVDIKASVFPQELQDAINAIPRLGCQSVSFQIKGTTPFEWIEQSYDKYLAGDKHGDYKKSPMNQSMASVGRWIVFIRAMTQTGCIREDTLMLTVNSGYFAQTEYHQICKKEKGIIKSDDPFFNSFGPRIWLKKLGGIWKEMSSKFFVPETGEINLQGINAQIGDSIRVVQVVKRWECFSARELFITIVDPPITPSVQVISRCPGNVVAKVSNRDPLTTYNWFDRAGNVLGVGDQISLNWTKSDTIWVQGVRVCETAKIEVPIELSPRPSLWISDTLICAGDSSTLWVEGGAVLHWYHDGNIVSGVGSEIMTNLPGNYWAQVLSDGCQFLTDTVQIQVANLPTYQTNPSRPTTGQPFTIYPSHNSDRLYILQDDKWIETNELIIREDRNITFKITNSSGCERIWTEQIVFGCGGGELGEHIKIFPNPVERGNNVHIKMNDCYAKQANISIIDMTGRNVKSLSYVDHIDGMRIPADFIAGVYIVTITSGSVSATKKLVVY